MGALTEIEIFDCMATNLRLAAEHCDELAVKPLKGPIYEKLRDELALIEGCCKQASAWREDTRWLNIGLLMADCHKKAGGWLRGYKIYGTRVKLEPGHLNLCFVKLAENLRALLTACDAIKNKKAPKLGMIVPEPVRPFMRDDRPIRVMLPPSMSKGGILIPHGAVH